MPLPEPHFMPPRNVRVIDCGSCGSFLIFSLGGGSGGGASWKAWLGQDRPTVAVANNWRKADQSNKAAELLTSSDSDDSDDSNDFSSHESPSPVPLDIEVRQSRLLRRKALSETQPRSVANAGIERSISMLSTQSAREKEFMADMRAMFPSYQIKGNSGNPSDLPKTTDRLSKRKNTCNRARGSYDFSSMESSRSSPKRAGQNQHQPKKLRL